MARTDPETLSVERANDKALVNRRITDYTAAPFMNLSDEKPDVLVLDDDANICQMSEMILRNAHFKPVVAKNCEDAAELAEKFEASLGILVIDAMMPGCSGLDFATIMHARYPQFRILLISGSAERIRQKAAELGPNAAALAKPFNFGDFALRVRELMDRPIQAQQS